MEANARYTIDDLIELERKHFGRKAKPDASGKPILTSPDMAHSMVRTEVIVLLKTWQRGGALPGHDSGFGPIHCLDGWLCQPDVSIVSKTEKCYPERAPLLAVEIRSNYNTWREMRAKAARYLEYGSAMVWLIDPRRQTLELHQSGEAPQTLTGDDVIDGGATLPGFRVTVSDLFPG